MFNALVDGFTDAAIMLDSARRIQAVNTVFLDLFHYETAALLGQTLTDALPEADALQRACRDIPKGRDEIVWKGRNIEITLAELPEGQLLLLRDITAHKHIESTLHTYERRYHALFQNSNDAILILDLNLHIVSANEQIAEMLGTTLEILLDESDTSSFIPAEERVLFRALTAQLKNEETVPLYEMNFLRFDKQLIPTEVNFTLVRNEFGDALHIQMIIRDISERKFAETAMQRRYNDLALMRQVDSEANSSLDMEHVLQISLDIAARISGADSGFIALERGDAIRVAKVMGRLPKRVLNNKLRYDLGVVGRVLQSQQPEYIPDVAQDPDYYADVPDTQSLMAVPLTSQGRLIGIINLESSDAKSFNKQVFELVQLMANRLSVAIDNARLYHYVTQQLEETQNLNEQLRKAESLKTDMIRIANHDLKNPLGIVQGYLHLLRHDFPEMNKDIEEYFYYMDESLQRMQNILKDFLTVEAINERAKGASNIRMDLRDLVWQAVSEYQMQSLEKRQELIESYPQPEQAMIKGDKEQLYEAICNLISNAIKYTPERGTIRIELSLTEDMGVIFAVHDTGYGIPEDRQNRLFEPFFRSRTAETATIEGTGLGLHLVKNIIERHQGTMLFKSIYREGSTFGFRLSLSQLA